MVQEVKGSPSDSSCSGYLVASYPKSIVHTSFSQRVNSFMGISSVCSLSHLKRIADVKRHYHYESKENHAHIVNSIPILCIAGSSLSLTLRKHIGLSFTPIAILHRAYSFTIRLEYLTRHCLSLHSIYIYTHFLNASC